MQACETERLVSCRVKSFFPRKGFEFLEPLGGGADILIHQNVLKEAGVPPDSGTERAIACPASDPLSSTKRISSAAPACRRATMS